MAGFRASKDDNNDSISQSAASPSKLPKYRDPAHVKYMSSVMQDLNVIKKGRVRFGPTAQSLSPTNKFGDSVEMASQEDDGVEIRHAQTLNIGTDGKLEIMKSNLSQTQKFTTLIDTSPDEKLSVMIKQVPAKGK